MIFNAYILHFALKKHADQFIRRKIKILSNFLAHQLITTFLADQPAGVSVNKLFGKRFKFLIMKND